MRARVRASSIAARLTLLYTLGALAAVALFALLVDWKLAVNFDAEHLRFVQAKVDELQTDLDDGGGHPQPLLAEILKETAGTRLRQYQARVLARDGVLGQTPDMQRSLPPSTFPPPAGSGGMRRADLRERRAGDRTWLLATVPLHAAAATGPLTVQLALDVTRDRALLAGFNRALAIFFLLLVPLLAIAGRWVASRALAPVARIARAAGQVTPARLSARIPESPPWPRELDGLVAVFNDMLARLEEAFARLSRFSADLAHELRTPLSNLSGELEVCLAHPRTAPEYRAALESGLEECRRLNALIENLLFLARAERAELAVRREPFAAEEAAGWVIAQHGPGAAARGVRIELEGRARLVADPVLFRQALGNLLANAVRHAPDGSTVTVRLQRHDDGAGELCVSDQGEGIAPQHLPHVFERFYRADPARGRGLGQGTGLGLSIVRSIMALHGGHAIIESTPGEGTTVRLRFPAAAE